MSARGREEGSTRFLRHLAPWIAYASAGGVVAVSSAALINFRYIWGVLAVVGLAIGLWSLLAKNFQNYWIGVFVFALPLEIKKLLTDSDHIRAITNLHGIPLGELPSPILYLTDLPLFVLLFAWFVRVASRKEGLSYPKGSIFAILFLCCAALSTFQAKVVSYSLYDLLRNLKFFLLYLFAFNTIKTKSTYKIIMHLGLVAMFFQGAICLYQYKSQDMRHVFGNAFGQQDLYTEDALRRYEAYFNVSGEADGSAVRRASGTVGPNNAQAQYFEYTLPFAFLLGVAATRALPSAIYLAMFAVGAAGLFVTFSRGGLVGMAVGLAATLLLARRFRLVSSRRFQAVALVGIALCAGAAPLAYEYLTARSEAAFARWDLMKVGFAMISDHPFLGVGLNNHLVAKPFYDPQTYSFPMPVHNRYVLLATEIGVPGLVFFVAFLVSSMVAALRSARLADGTLRVAGAGLFAALLSISVHTLVDNLYSHTTLTLFWLYAGLAAALANQATPLIPSQKSPQGPPGTLDAHVRRGESVVQVPGG